MSISLTMSAKCNAATEADSRTQKTERIQPAWQGERTFHPWPLATAPAHPPTDPLPQASAAYTEGESTSRCSTLLDEVDGDGRMSSCSSPLATRFSGAFGAKSLGLSRGLVQQLLWYQEGLDGK